MYIVPKKLSAMVLVILCLSLGHSPVRASEANYLSTIDFQPPETAQKVNWIDLIKALVDRSDILFGFLLGLGGTIFVDYLRRRRGVKEFRTGLQSELKLILGVVTWLIFNLDARLSIEKIRSMQQLFKEFDLYMTLNPCGDSSTFQEYMSRELTDSDIQQFVALRDDSIDQRAQRGVQQGFMKLKCTFIQNNISSISLLPKEDQKLLMNILRRFEAINAAVPRLDFCLQKSYDNVTAENRERLNNVYSQSCQWISDWSHDTAKEIASFLRRG